MHITFTGEVKMMKGSYGFIERRWVRGDNGEEFGSGNFESTEDIFFRTAEFPQARVGSKLTFNLVPDARRGDKTFRAIPVRFVEIELHFEEISVDHPTVQIRWCLSPEAHHLIRERKDDSWYIAIVAQPHRKEHETNYSHQPGTTIATWIGLKRIGDSFGYINFLRSGPHSVVAYLVASRGSEKSLKKHFDRLEDDTIDVWEGAERGVLATDASNLSFLRRKGIRNDRVQGIAHVAVSVPEGIFAKPLSPGMKQWLAYFGVTKLRDQCDGRGKKILTCLLGPFAFILWESVKRSWMILLGILHFCLAGGSPFPLWRRAFSRNLSALISDWKGALEYEPLTVWEDRNLWKHPLPWFAVLAPSAWLLVSPPDSTKWPILILSLILAVIAIIVVVGLFGENIDHLLNRFVRERRNRYHDAVMNRIEQYTSCNSITAKSVPSPTVRLVWTGIKRRVCRTYAD